MATAFVATVGYRKDQMVLPLDSPRWRTLEASSGGTGEFAATLLMAGADVDFVELYHAACHQLTVCEAAYAIVPHVVSVAESLRGTDRVWPLVIAGTVAACRAAQPGNCAPVPSDLQADFDQANARALVLAAEALRQRNWTEEESLLLLAVVAALQGRGELAIQLFMCVPGEELACPSCGERLRVDSSGEQSPG